jgi:hypothetical protein
MYFVRIGKKFLKFVKLLTQDYSMKKVVMIFLIVFLLIGTCFSQEYKIIHLFEEERLGVNPIGSLVAVDSFLYGMTQDGGIYSGGTIYKNELPRSKLRGIKTSTTALYKLFDILVLYLAL